MTQDYSEAPTLRPGTSCSLHIEWTGKRKKKQQKKTYLHWTWMHHWGCVSFIQERRYKRTQRCQSSVRLFVRFCVLHEFPYQTDLASVLTFSTTMQITAQQVFSRLHLRIGLHEKDQMVAMDFRWLCYFVISVKCSREAYIVAQQRGSWQNVDT